MLKTTALATAFLLVLASTAYAADEKKPAPTKPTTGQGAATTVETNPAATESGGKADKGLSTAEKNITKPKKHMGKKNGMEEKGEKMERPSRPEQPAGR